MWLLALPSTILPEAVTNLTPVLVQIIEMPSPFKLLITGPAVAIPSVNPYRNNTAIIKRRDSLNGEKAFMRRDSNTAARNVERCLHLTDVKSDRIF